MPKIKSWSKQKTNRVGAVWKHDRKNYKVVVQKVQKGMSESNTGYDVRIKSNGSTLYSDEYRTKDRAMDEAREFMKNNPNP